MSDKPKIAFYWCASCGGCDESVVDLAEDILKIMDLVDIIFWPVALDYKLHSIESMADQSIDITFINGAIRTSEQDEIVRLLRRKSKFIIAYGTCAQWGGIPGLSNQFTREEIFDFVYSKSPSVDNNGNVRPQTDYQTNHNRLNLPKFYNLVRSLDQVVDVDYYIPGCPPTAKLLKDALLTIFAGKLPPKGSVLAPDTALCETCPRKDSKPVDVKFVQFKRVNRFQPDSCKCFLADNLVCMGPATRGGCEALCIQGNMPCSGCFGPTSRVRDQGGKILSFLTSCIDACDGGEIDKVTSGIPDPVGTFYRYSLPKSFLRKKFSV